MPFEIVRNDITVMQVDAIVNAANHRATIGTGVDAGIHKQAGSRLLKARQKIGIIEVGEAAITPAFDLDAKYVIHAVSPLWRGGAHNEEVLLGQCYRRALALARAHHCRSIAFPLLATGNHAFPKPLALQIAIREISAFLMEHEMLVYLVVFSRDAFVLSEKLFHSVVSYIDETYIHTKTLDEYGISDAGRLREADHTQLLRRLQHRERLRDADHFPPMRSFCAPAAAAPMFSANAQDWDSLLQKLDASFSETLLHLIDRSGKKDAEVYKKANIDRKLFSKIRNNRSYKPSKPTALAFAIALELNLDETKDLIARAGYALSHSSKFDIIVEYFILHKSYDVFELNEVLFAFDQPLLGA